jgi:hypothetical protein
VRVGERTPVDGFGEADRGSVSLSRYTFKCKKSFDRRVTSRKLEVEVGRERERERESQREREREREGERRREREETSRWSRRGPSPRPLAATSCIYIYIEVFIYRESILYICRVYTHRCVWRESSCVCVRAARWPPRLSGHRTRAQQDCGRPPSSHNIHTYIYIYIYIYMYNIYVYSLRSSAQ